MTTIRPTSAEPEDCGPKGPRRRRLFLAAGVPFLLLVSLYLADVLITSAKVPRGVIAAGVPLGGLTPDEAERRLQDVIGPRTSLPVLVTLGTVDAEVDPSALDLVADLRATVDEAGTQPLNPVTRLASFFVKTPIGVVSSLDDQALTAKLEELAGDADEHPVEGSIIFVDSRPVSSDPQSGWRLDVNAAADVFRRDWASGETLDLPMVELPPSTTATDVAVAVRDIATPAVSGPVILNGDNNTQAVLTEDVIAAALTFRPENGRLSTEIDESLITEALRPQLAASEIPGRDADIDFAAVLPVKVPAQDGRRVDYSAALTDLLAALSSTDGREFTAVFENGRPARGVGGGVSQMATTLFNAAYFAGMENIEHHEHSYYISRYPAGREATVFGDVLDVKFRNDGPTSVQIQTAWTTSSITARLIGIRRYEVTSSQSSRSRPTSPHTVTIPAGETCSASSGAPGFTITDTRTRREITSGQTSSEPHTVVYDPIPRVVCSG